MLLLYMLSDVGEREAEAGCIDLPRRTMSPLFADF